MSMNLAKMYQLVEETRDRLKEACGQNMSLAPDDSGVRCSNFLFTPHEALRRGELRRCWYVVTAIWEMAICTLT